MSLYNIRNVKQEDIEAVYLIEKECFPPAEAATEKQLTDRINVFGNHFYVLEFSGKVVGFINGMVTNQNTISDEMFEDVYMHDENGKYQTVFGLDVLEKYRGKGFASFLMEELIKNAKKENRKGVILTCKENLRSFYEKFGYEEKGISKSVHGGALWYDMVLIL